MSTDAVASVRPSLVERAFELAQSGDCIDVNDIRFRLHREGYEHRYLQGPSLMRQLRQLMAAARKATD